MLFVAEIGLHCIQCTAQCTQNHPKATKISEKVIKLVGEREREKAKETQL